MDSDPNRTSDKTQGYEAPVWSICVLPYRSRMQSRVQLFAGGEY